MTGTDKQARFYPYWERFAASSARGETTSRLPPGDELAALRRGTSGGPGTVPSMWRFYTPDWTDERAGLGAPFSLVAEHHALVLFAIHQQSQQVLVHQPGKPIGQAIKALHTSGRFAPAAVDRRFFAAVTAPEVAEVAHHLRGLVRQLRSLQGPAPFDYSGLCRDLRWWHDPACRDAARRRWGMDYYRPTPDGPDTLPASREPAGEVS